MTEYVFWHRACRTLILTDLIEKFEPHRLALYVARWLVRLGGVEDPLGGMPRDMRLTSRRRTLRAAVEQMINSDPERIIVVHGRCYDRDGTAELQRTFRWLLS